MKGLEKFNELVECFAKLPGVGKKSAQRYAYFVSLQDSFGGLRLAQSIEDAVRFLRRCERCGSLSENEICDICADESRDKSSIVVVESPRDVLVFEQNGIYNGAYFVLDELSELKLEALRDLALQNGAREIIFAFTPGLNSDALMLFVQDKLGLDELNFSKIAQGVPTGVSLENIDMLSLMKAFESRTKA